MILIFYLLLGAIAVLLIYVSTKWEASYKKDIIKHALQEYEEERHRREDAEQALLELDELEKELNEKSRE